jgi:hypothetical protein
MTDLAIYSHYAYDDMGRLLRLIHNQLIRRTVDAGGPGSGPAVDTFFVYEDGRIVLEFSGGSTPAVTHRYLWGPNDDQLLTDEVIGGSLLWPFVSKLR